MGLSARLVATMSITLAIAGPVLASAPPPLQSERLPAGTVKADGKSPLYLLVKVKDGKVTGYESATQKTANVTATFSASNGTTITFTSTLDTALKFELYISADGRRFVYTSSCPLMARKSLYENWPHPVPWLAITGVAVSDGSGSCR